MRGGMIIYLFEIGYIYSYSSEPKYNTFCIFRVLTSVLMVGST